MKKIILLVAIFITTFTFSQTQTRDVVYLKNGSIIKGQIKEMNPSENLKIETGDGSLFVYKMDEILKMEKEEFIGKEVNQETSTSVSQAAIDKFFSDYLTEKRPALKFVGVSKKNGIKKEVFGQKTYEIEYELIFETEQNIYINASQFGSAWSNKFVDDFSYSLKGSDGYEAALAGAKKLIERGNRIVANGTLNFEETDNGWRATNFNNKNFKTVSSNYVSPQMAEQNKQENAKKQASFASQGDWKQSDISELTLNPIYLKADHVPLFENSSNMISVEKLANSCNDCRNDNIMAIESIVNKAILNTNRFSTINATEFENSSNNAKYTISINQITFKHKGVKEDGSDKGFSCSINYGMLLNATFTSPNDLNVKDTKAGTATSSIWNIYSNKKSAFGGALKDLEEQIKKIIFRYEPLSLKVKSIELDKKGNPEYLTLENTNNLFNKKKVNFNIIENSSLSINNNKFRAGNVLGEVTYKQSDFPNEIKVKIKKNKLKKALKDFIGKENELIGLSNSK